MSEIPIDENNYKVDFIILDKYQLFSAEILRLSLLGLAIYGFFMANVIFKAVASDNTYIFLNPFMNNKLVFILGAVSLLLSALLALGHRYFSTDCMTHFVRLFRLRKGLGELETGETKADADVPAKTNELKKKIEGERASFEMDLSRCKWLLLSSCLFLVVGIALVIGGLGKTLIDATPISGQ